MKTVNLIRLLISLAWCITCGMGSTFALENGFTPTDFWSSMRFNKINDSNEPLISVPIFSQLEQIFYHFSNFIKNNGPRNSSTPAEKSPIPTIIHFIWLGSDIPRDAQVSIASWEKHHPGWQIKVWRDSDLKDFTWTSTRTKINFYTATSYAEKADILRYEILYQFGGVYSDTDIICLKSFHDLIDSGLQFFAGIEHNYPSTITKNPLHVGTAIIGSVKGSATMKYCLDHHMGLSESPGDHILIRTGPGLCSRAVAESVEEKKEKVLLLPVSYFYPFPFEYRHLPFDRAMTYQAPETMAIHLWRASWIPKELLEKIKNWSQVT